MPRSSLKNKNSNSPETPFSNWTVAQLKKELKDKNLPVSGTKQKLIDRLLEENTPTKTKLNNRMQKRETESEEDYEVLNYEDSPLQMKQLKQKIEKEKQQLTIWRSPIMTLKYFILELIDLAQSFIHYFQQHRQILFLLSILLVTLIVVHFNFPHLMAPLEDQFLWYGWWVLLGIASSIGLGTGLHTFLLFLGPFIAKVTVFAYDCGNLNFNIRELICDETAEKQQITLTALFLKVWLESFFWGAGTAIGELPPYYVARAAALAGREDEEIDHIEALKKKRKKNLWERVQLFMFDLMQRFGFFGILVSASIPNPLFDLAGITCGHFLVPFSTFFGATFIGKALIKASLQTGSVILLFSKENIDVLLKFLKRFQPSLSQFMTDFLHSQRQKFSTGAKEEQVGSWIGFLWNGLITLMIAYFALSIVHSMAAQYYQKEVMGEAQTKNDRNRKRRQLRKALQ